MNYGGLRFCDVANGTGCRVSLFVSGCTNNCPGCFNKEAQDFNYGQKFTDDTLKELLDGCEHDYITGLTILGGEPMHPRNQPTVASIITTFRKRFCDKKTIWVFTGYVLEKDLDPGRRVYTDYTPVILDNIDVLVDGPFVEALKDPSLKFRGSSNQRHIYLKDGRPYKVE